MLPAIAREILMSAAAALEERIATVRRFNRFYTRKTSSRFVSRRPPPSCDRNSVSMPVTSAAFWPVLPAAGWSRAPLPRRIAGKAIYP